MAKEIEIKRNKAVYTRIFIIALLGLISSIFYYLSILADSSLLWMIIISATSVLFLIMLVSSTRMLINNRPALKLTSEGIEDRISLASAGKIKWQDIKSVKLEHYLNSEQILISIKEPQKLIESLPYFKRKMVNQQFIDTGAVIVINPKMIKGKPKDIVQKIKRRARIS